jgi:HAD superfamily hydrolase (TIGR01509 family)
VLNPELVPILKVLIIDNYRWGYNMTTTLITHVLCDLGHVLIPAELSYEKNKKILIKHYNLEHSTTERQLAQAISANPEHDLYCRGKITTEDYYQAVQKYLQPFLPKSTIIDKQDLKKMLCENIYEYDQQVLEFLINFREQGLKVAIVTDTHEWQSECFRKRILFDDYADYVFESHIVGLLKDDRDYFPLILHRLKIAGKNVMLIDDKPANNDAASQFGIYAPGFKTAEQFKSILQEKGLIN